MMSLHCGGKGRTLDGERKDEHLWVGSSIQGFVLLSGFQSSFLVLCLIHTNIGIFLPFVVRSLFVGFLRGLIQIVRDERLLGLYKG